MGYFIKKGSEWLEVPKPDNKMIDIRVGVAGSFKELWNAFPLLKTLDIQLTRGLKNNLRVGGTVVADQLAQGVWSGKSSTPVSFTELEDPGGNVSGSSGFTINLETGRLTLVVFPYYSTNYANPTFGQSTALVRVNDTWYYARVSSRNEVDSVYQWIIPELQAKGDYTEFSSRWGCTNSVLDINKKEITWRRGVNKGESYIESFPFYKKR